MTLILYVATKHGNQHGGVPRVLMNSNNRARPVTPSDLPATADAVQLYRQHGQLTDPYEVGSDPLVGDPNKILLRKQAKLGLKFYIDVTRRLHLSC